MKDTEFISKTAEQYAEKFNIKKSVLYEVGLIGLREAEHFNTQDMSINLEEYKEKVIEETICRYCKWFC